MSKQKKKQAKMRAKHARSSKVTSKIIKMDLEVHRKRSNLSKVQQQDLQTSFLRRIKRR